MHVDPPLADKHASVPRERWKSGGERGSVSEGPWKLAGGVSHRSRDGSTGARPGRGGGGGSCGFHRPAAGDGDGACGFRRPSGALACGCGGSGGSASLHHRLISLTPPASICAEEVPGRVPHFDSHPAGERGSVLRGRWKSGGERGSVPEGPWKLAGGVSHRSRDGSTGARPGRGGGGGSCGFRRPSGALACGCGGSGGSASLHHRLISLTPPASICAGYAPRRAARRGCPAARQGCPTARQGCPTARQGCPAARQGCPAARQGYPAARQGCRAARQRHFFPHPL